jgi:CheY-like chemotaxis protein
MQIRARHAGRYVLLVEDAPINLDISATLLQEAGLKVGVAKNGAKAVQMARKNRYALILMDLQMPVLDGFNAARAIRLEPLNADTPIIAITANDAEEDRQGTIAAGMNDLIPKPVDPELLYVTLLKWLDK